MLPEDSYGRRKRLAFITAAAQDHRARRILDIGCGTGANLTLPLAEILRDAEILGTDVDTGSIEHARRSDHPPNVRFATIDAMDEEGEPFDLVIASEVLEHVDDPVAFLDRLGRLTRPGGRLVVTVPNGYGPFEWCALLESLLHLSGIQAILRAIKRGLPKRSANANECAAPTLAVSPHINFFSCRSLMRLFDGTGLRVRRFQPTTFLCGYGLDSIVKGGRAVAWNASIADRLPAWCASDWMFELEPGNRRRLTPWHPNLWNRLRRRLNRRRWGIA